MWRNKISLPFFDKNFAKNKQIIIEYLKFYLQLLSESKKIKILYETKLKELESLKNDEEKHKEKVTNIKKIDNFLEYYEQILQETFVEIKKLSKEINKLEEKSNNLSFIKFKKKKKTKEKILFLKKELLEFY